MTDVNANPLEQEDLNQEEEEEDRPTKEVLIRNSDMTPE